MCIHEEEGMLEVGQVINGRYQLVRLLGGGGQGEVWQALDLDTRACRALKFLRAEGGVISAQRKELFYRESALLSMIQGTHVVKLCQEDTLLLGCVEVPFQVLEWIDGDDLETIMSRHDWMQRKTWDRLRLFRDALKALIPVGQSDVIHGDVKPSNFVFCDVRQHCLLIDFGSAQTKAQANHERERLRPIFGTSEYIAPELLDRREVVGPQADVYAAGVMLFQMLMGCLPFVGRDANEILPQHRLAEIPVVTGLPEGPMCDRAMTEIVMIAMAKSPERRLQNAMAFLRVLERKMEWLSSFEYTVGHSYGASVVSAASEVLSIVSSAVPRMTEEFAVGGQSQSMGAAGGIEVSVEAQGIRKTEVLGSGHVVALRTSCGSSGGMYRSTRAVLPYYVDDSVSFWERWQRWFWWKMLLALAFLVGAVSIPFWLAASQSTKAIYEVQPRKVKEEKKEPVSGRMTPPERRYLSPPPMGQMLPEKRLKSVKPVVPAKRVTRHVNPSEQSVLRRRVAKAPKKRIRYQRWKRMSLGHEGRKALTFGEQVGHFFMMPWDYQHPKTLKAAWGLLRQGLRGVANCGEVIPGRTIRLFFVVNPGGWLRRIRMYRVPSQCGLRRRLLKRLERVRLPLPRSGSHRVQMRLYIKST